MTTPLCRCRVLYIGSAIPTVTKDGLQGIQEPLKERYPTENTSETQGIDSWLTVWSNGLLVEYVEGRRKTEAQFHPIQSLHYCAAVRYVNIPGYSVPDGAERFLPLDSPFAAYPDPRHPPIFAAILRRTTGVKVLECHSFICTNERAANALVRCCFAAYADSAYIQATEGASPTLPNGPQKLLAIKPKLSSGSESAESSESPEAQRWTVKSSGDKWRRRQQSGEFDDDAVSLDSNLAEKYGRKTPKAPSGRSTPVAMPMAQWERQAALVEPRPNPYGPPMFGGPFGPPPPGPYGVPFRPEMMGPRPPFLPLPPHFMPPPMMMRPPPPPMLGPYERAASPRPIVRTPSPTRSRAGTHKSASRLSLKQNGQPQYFEEPIYLPSNFHPPPQHFQPPNGFSTYRPGAIPFEDFHREKKSGKKEKKTKSVPKGRSLSRPPSRASYPRQPPMWGHPYGLDQPDYRGPIIIEQPATLPNRAGGPRTNGTLTNGKSTPQPFMNGDIRGMSDSMRGLTVASVHAER